MSQRAQYTVRRMWWRQFHPLVRVGWYVATTGKNRPAVQTAVGVGMVGAGLILRGSRKKANKPIYKYVSSPGDTTRIRVFRGSSLPSETVIRS